MSYEQCIEHLINTDGTVMTWVKIGLPLLVSTVTVATTYWLTTRKERKALKDNQERARAVVPGIWLVLDDLVKEGKTISSPNAFREFVSKTKGVSEYGALFGTEADGRSVEVLTKV